MLPFNTLPRIIVVHLMITVAFRVNDFVWRNGVSNFLSPLKIVEGTSLDYHLNFRVMHSEFLPTCKGSINDMTLRTMNALALVPNTNFQAGVKKISLATGKVLQRQ